MEAPFRCSTQVGSLPNSQILDRVNFNNILHEFFTRKDSIAINLYVTNKGNESLPNA